MSSRLTVLLRLQPNMPLVASILLSRRQFLCQGECHCWSEARASVSKTNFAGCVLGLLPSRFGQRMGVVG